MNLPAEAQEIVTEYDENRQAIDRDWLNFADQGIDIEEGSDRKLDDLEKESQIIACQDAVGDACITTADKLLELIRKDDDMPSEVLTREKNLREMGGGFKTKTIMKMFSEKFDDLHTGDPTIEKCNQLNDLIVQTVDEITELLDRVNGQRPDVRSSFWYTITNLQCTLRKEIVELEKAQQHV